MKSLEYFVQQIDNIFNQLVYETKKKKKEFLKVRIKV